MSNAESRDKARNRNYDIFSARNMGTAFECKSFDAVERAEKTISLNKHTNHMFDCCSAHSKHWLIKQNRIQIMHTQWLFANINTPLVQGTARRKKCGLKGVCALDKGGKFSAKVSWRCKKKCGPGLGQGRALDKKGTICINLCLYSSPFLVWGSM